MKRPRVYLAGKIAKCDWRHTLVPRLREALYEQGPIDCSTFTYVGPYFVSCDHGCNHGPNTHGAITKWGGTAEPCYGPEGCVPPDRAEIARRAREGVCSADLIFAYVEALDCVGTMAEIGFAVALRKPVVLCIAPGIEADECWLVAHWPGVTRVSDVHRSDLPKVLTASLAMGKRGSNSAHEKRSASMRSEK